jgi:tRNA A37 N6-isopentenylltransferase MiaA
MAQVSEERPTSAAQPNIQDVFLNYARRQLIWFRKEPTLIWFDGPGERPATLERVVAALATRGILEETVPDGSGH